LANIILKESSMIEIKKVLKKEIPNILNDDSIWKHEFLSATKHRLYAHYKNPDTSDDDIVLLLAYLDNELVGYMGVYINKISLNNKEHKIGWLSTWWVHPKTKGTGIGKEILNTMYQINNGKIGISAFTESAKRVYDKSGYFYTLKVLKGVKAVLRSNLKVIIPLLMPKLRKLKPLFNLFDGIFNILIDAKLNIQKFNIKNKLDKIDIDYVNIIDHETNEIINKYNANHLSNKKPEFFEWLKAYQWVQEAPVIEKTLKGKYEFTMCDRSFNIYLIKVLSENVCIGFIVLQRRNNVIKVLFAYYDKIKYSGIISNIIILQAINQKVSEIVCYDEAICHELKNSSVFIYKRKKVSESIISKAFNISNFDDVVMNLGDGDSCFT
jgi:hypothetical protein